MALIIKRLNHFRRLYRTIRNVFIGFEEFLWANGIEEQSILDVKEFFDKKEVVPQAMHERMMELFKEYIVVGGMPRVVNDFVKNHNFANVLKFKKQLLVIMKMT